MSISSERGAAAPGGMHLPAGRAGLRADVWSFYISQAPGAAKVSLAVCQNVVLDHLLMRLFAISQSC